MRYLGRRLLHGVFVLLGVSVLSFVLLNLAPGDFFEEMRLNPQISPETVAALRAQHALDRPLPERYWRWVRSLLAGELGLSLAYNTPVAPLLWARAQNTLVLTGTATLAAWLLAIPLGVAAAVRRGRPFDRLCSVSTSVLLAIPDLALALSLLLLAARTGRLPVGGMLSPGAEQLGFWERATDLGSHLLLPTLALVLGTLPVLVRHVRAAMTEVLESPFLRAASGHGIPRRRLIWRHALPAGANPLITLFGFSFGTLLSGSLLVEVVMSWPGLGPLLLEAILARDVYLVVGAVVLSAVFLAGGSLLADLLLYAVDPRIHAQ